jgi:type VI secretion system secreted protein Hcp
MALLFYATMKGQKQGDIKGDCKQKGREGSMVCSAFESHCEAPRDVQSGLPTGKRRYSPIRIVKELDQASPLIWAALTTNENLKEVTFKFYRPSSKGVEEQFYTIKLTNARICGVRILQHNMHEMENAKVPLEEEVEFTFQKISWENLADKKMAEDDWEAPMA